MSLLLFTPHPPSAPVPGLQAMSRMARQAPDGPARAPVSQPGAFELSSAEWRQLAAFTDAALQMRAAIRDGAPRISALQEIAGAWQPLDGQLDGWPGARDALRALGGDIIGYAHDVAPPLYGRIAEILQRLPDGPDTALADELRGLLTKATAEADARAARAAQWSATIGPLADAARRFVEAVNKNPRNPPIRVEFRDIPFLCLSRKGLEAIAGDERNTGDPGQFWVVEQVEPDGRFTLRTPDGALTLFVPHVDGMEERIAPPFIQETREQVMEEGSPPGLMPTRDIVNQNRDETLFWFTSEGYMQPMQWPHHTLDCAGNDGWGQGTPLHNWSKWDGRNQKWKMHPRTFWDLQFYDACQQVAQEAAGIPSFQHLQGDWLAISRDLNDGINGVLHQLDAGVPFIAQLDVEATMKAWSDAANEAQMATAGL